MSIINLDYQTLLIIAVALFALGGFLRGWWREGITTAFLVLLTVFLTRPELADTIIAFINTGIETVWNLVSGILGGLVPAGQAATAAAAEPTPPIVLDPNDRTTYILILIAIVVVSYFTSKITLGGRTITVGGRIFGGILGAINGYLALNLIMEFIVGRFFPETGLTAQSAAPNTVSIAVNNVPPESIFANTPLLLVIGFGVVILALVLANRLSRTGTRTPWGYK